METESEIVSFYNPETDKLFEVTLSVEDTRRARTDMIYATEIMNDTIQRMELEQEQQHLLTAPTEKKSQAQAEDYEEADSVYRWTTPCILLLLEIYKTVEEKLSSGKHSQKKVWEEVSSLLKIKGHSITGLQCAAELRSLKKTYKSVKDHNSKSGNDRRSWQFYEIMDSIFAKKAWAAPVAVASSSGLSIRPGAEAGPATSTSSCDDLPASATKATTLLAKRLHQKEEHEQNKAKRHKERLVMDEKLLAVFEKLVNK